jgi:hypothetical protein
MKPNIKLAALEAKQVTVGVEFAYSPFLEKSNAELLFGCFCCNRFSLLEVKLVFPEA